MTRASPESRNWRTRSAAQSRSKAKTRGKIAGTKVERPPMSILETGSTKTTMTTRSNPATTNRECRAWPTRNGECLLPAASLSAGPVTGAASSVLTRHVALLVSAVGRNSSPGPPAANASGQTRKSNILFGAETAHGETGQKAQLLVGVDELCAQDLAKEVDATGMRPATSDCQRLVQVGAEQHHDDVRRPRHGHSFA